MFIESMETDSTLNTIEEVAKLIVNSIDEFNESVVLFDGEMGAGKTTTIAEVVKLLGCDDEVSSPTFGIVNNYFSDKRGDVYHFDFYRIEDEEEAIYSGLDEMIDSGNICLIEWSEKIPNLLPDSVVRVVIKILEDNHRKINITHDIIR